jgi:ABC-type amino acid transport substrate-binding protein
MNGLSSLLKLTAIVILTIGSFPVLAQQDVSVAVYAKHEQYISASAPYGLSWKLLELAAQSQGLILIPQKGSWQGGMLRLNASKVDLMFPAFKNQERAQWALFTLPLLPTGSSIFTLRDNPVNQLVDINFAKAMVGVVKGSVQETLAQEVGFEHIYTTTQQEQLYTMLKEKRLNYLFVASAVVGYYCTYFGELGETDCLKQIGDDYGNKFARALSLNTPPSKTIMDAINTGFVAVKGSPEVQNLFKEFNYSEQDLADWRLALTNQ